MTTSPPPLCTNLPPRSIASSDSNPISPVSRSGTFPHKTSPAVVTQTPLIDTSTPAINEAPVELDGRPASPRRASAGGVISPADEEDIDGEFLGEGESAGRGLREKRAAMLASRSQDPGVIVDVPQDPTAEEVQAARKADEAVSHGRWGSVVTNK